MFRRKPSWYLNKLEEKGWKTEEIVKKTRIKAIRLKKLYLPNALATRDEITKIYSLFKLTPPCKTEEVRKVWSEMNNQPVEYTGPVLTEKQQELLIDLRDAVQRDNTLTGSQALVARRLIEPGLIERRDDTVDGESVRLYRITDDGLLALRHLGV